MEGGIAHLELFFGIDLVVFIGLIALTLFIFTALLIKLIGVYWGKEVKWFGLFGIIGLQFLL